MNIMYSILLQSSLGQESSNIADKVMGFLKNFGLTDQVTSILGGVVVLILGLFIAKFVSRLIARVIRRTGIDDKLKGGVQISALLGKLVYFLLMILVLMTALNIMGVGEEVMTPLNDMVAKFTGAIPNIITAGIIIYIGYFLAKIVSEFIEMSADTINNAIPKLRLPEGINLVKIIKNIIFIFIFIPILIVGLEFLNFDAITVPATSMLAQFMNAIPLIIQAAIVVVIGVFGGKLVASLLKELLSNMNIDSLAQKIGLDKIMGNYKLSGMVAAIVQYFFVYTAVMQALNILGLDQIAVILNDIVYVAGKVIFGLLILVLGNVVANFTTSLFSNDSTSKFTMAIMRSAIIVIFLAMGLNAMDIADSIINLAFGLGLGAIAVAFALSFGLGGKEAAGEEMKKFFKKFDKNN